MKDVRRGWPLRKVVNSVVLPKKMPGLAKLGPRAMDTWFLQEVPRPPEREMPTLPEQVWEVLDWEDWEVHYAHKQGHTASISLLTAWLWGCRCRRAPQWPTASFCASFFFCRVRVRNAQSHLWTMQPQKKKCRKPMPRTPTRASDVIYRCGQENA